MHFFFENWPRMIPNGNHSLKLKRNEDISKVYNLVDVICMDEVKLIRTQSKQELQIENNCK